jgi:hypothetical protein
MEQPGGAGETAPDGKHVAEAAEPDLHPVLHAGNPGTGSDALTLSELAHALLQVSEHALEEVAPAITA